MTEPVRELDVYLLDDLGGFQDLAVQAAHLRALAQDMRDKEQAETATLLAMGAPIDNLLAHQQRLREGFDQVFGAFRSEENMVSHQYPIRDMLVTQHRQLARDPSWAGSARRPWGTVF